MRSVAFCFPPETATSWAMSGDACAPPLAPRVLDLVEVDGAGLALGIGAQLIGQALLGLRAVGAVPLDGAVVEAQVVAAGFRLDRAEALGLVERLHGSE